MRRTLKKWSILIGAGIMFQMPGCVEVATVVTSISSVLGTGGILYLVSRIVRD
jgi:hypothetical protein